MDNQIIIVSGDDWEGIYCNGLMQDEGHEIKRSDLIDWMKQYKTFDVDFYILNSKGQSWMEDRGCLPLRLEKILEEYLD